MVDVESERPLEEVQAEVESFLSSEAIFGKIPFVTSLLLLRELHGKTKEELARLRGFLPFAKDCLDRREEAIAELRRRLNEQRPLSAAEATDTEPTPLERL